MDWVKENGQPIFWIVIAVGTIISIYIPFLQGMYSSFGKVSWKYISNSVDKLAKSLGNQKYDLIICIGRNGAITGAMLSHRISKEIPIPIMMLNAKHSADDSSEYYNSFTRTVGVDGKTEVKFNKALLFSIDIITGETFKKARTFLGEEGIKTATNACLFWHPDSQIEPDFYVEKWLKRPSYPWMKKSFKETWGLSK